LSPPVRAALSRISRSVGFSWAKRSDEGVPEGYDLTKERLTAEIQRLRLELTEAQRSNDRSRAAQLIYGDIPLAKRRLSEWQKLH
jgi:hypothetical protein